VLVLAVAEPASTAILARRLGHSPSGVSEHLAALRDAGLLTSHRVGHQVIYERAPSPSPSPEPPWLQVGDPDPPPRGKAADTRIAMINSPLSAGNLEL
jgi:DNA-binding transcriptional ArsR family regulator